MRRARELAVALREAARRGRAAVKFPLDDRSLTMLPQKSRWFYKKTLLGDAVYMEQLAGQKQD